MFVGKRNTIFTEYRKDIIFPCIFWERTSFTFHLEKIYFLRKRNAIFSDDTRIFQCDFFGKTIFSEVWREYHISMYFFCWRSSFIFCLKNKIMFLGKQNIIFPDDTWKSYSSAIFLERPSFQYIWKEKIWFFVQWQHAKNIFTKRCAEWWALQLYQTFSIDCGFIVNVTSKLKTLNKMKQVWSNCFNEKPTISLLRQISETSLVPLLISYHWFFPIHPENTGLLMFLGEIEWLQWHEIT